MMRVGTVGKPHGLRGEVGIVVHTDAPEERFLPGGVVFIDGDEARPLHILAVKRHQGRWLVTFAEASDRTAVEGLRGYELYVPVEAGAEEPEANAWYASELRGLEVRGVAGERRGVVVELHTRSAQDLLEVRLSDGREGLVPFVEALVPVVDVPGGFVVIQEPPGLFDLE